MTAAGRWGGVTVDALDPEALAAFWAEVLGTTVRGRWHQYVSLEAAPGAPRLAFQQVDSKAAGKSPLHLDVHVATTRALEDLVATALERGALEVERHEQDGIPWVVLTDPEGNPFCVVSDEEQP